ncbi:MAG TPA: diguanylate cyclase [Terriglobia bacterium]|nr:diguanylate cyclase [Terriglobia bacterium]
MRILAADDDPVSLKMLETFLVKWQYEVVLATNGREALQSLQEFDPPRLAILDWMMPILDGLEVCQKVRKNHSAPYVYILMLTAKGRKQDIIEGLEGGADDYLTKPYDPLELRARLRAGRRILELQEQVRSAHRLIEDRTTVDPATGLWNRGVTLDILRNELASASEKGAPVSLVLANIDQFQEINTTYGNQAAAAVLREVTHRIRSAMRPPDTIGRFRADEFLIVLPECDAADAMAIADRFRTRVDRKAVDTPEGMIAVTLSLGVFTANLDVKADVDTVLSAANVALARAKNNGRNRLEAATLDDTRSPADPAVHSSHKTTRLD